MTRNRSVRIFFSFQPILLAVLIVWLEADASAKVVSVSDPTSPSSESAKSKPIASANAVSPDLDAKDPATQKALETLLFSENYKDRLIAQRNIRMALLPPAPKQPLVKKPAFNPIDKFIAAKWELAKLKHFKLPQTCTDNVFLRRAYLDLVGAIPTVAEAQKFLEDKSADKRARLVDTLLARNEDYAANWTPFWEDALASADVDMRGGIGTHGNLRQWIYDSIVTNKPYDVMVAELLDPLMPDYHKPTITAANGKRVVAAFVQNETHNETVLTAANTAQVFLGTGMKCASCHNHFLNAEWPQARFLGFAGMFATNDLELIRCEKKSGRMIEAKFPFDLPGMPQDMPKTVDERLHRLTQLLVDPTNPRFARTMVNRLWKRYIGIGLFAPIDDYRVDQPPSHPELLDWLADDFIRHGYDIKHTVRLILTSRTYQLRYEPAIEDHFDVAKPTLPRYYRSPSLRRMTAEELIDSIKVATTQSLDSKSRLYLQKTNTSLSRALGKPAARSEISTARAEDVAVVQSLELLNGEGYHHMIYEGQALKEALNDNDLGDEVDRLYWIALTREPTSKERKLGVAFLKKDEATNPGTEALGDILWALFTSPEFQYIR